ncbi:unnamed protein product [Rhizophagus irregularis]|nr:unnamed protein product [Rhizophagus irregularis]
MLVSQKLHVCQAILDTVILFPSEHRTHQLDLCKIITHQDFNQVASASHDKNLITIQEVGIELAQCLKNNQDISSEFELFRFISQT